MKYVVGFVLGFATCAALGVYLLKKKTKIVDSPMDETKVETANV